MTLTKHTDVIATLRRRSTNRCGWKRQSIFAWKGVEDQMGLIMGRMILPPDWLQRLLRASEDKDELDVERRRRALQDRLSRLKEMRLDGDVTKARFDSEKARLVGELGSLEALRSPASAAEDSAATLAQYASVWDYATLEERADIVRAVFETVYLDLDEVNRNHGEATSPVSAAHADAECRGTVVWRPRSDSNRRSPP